MMKSEGDEVMTIQMSPTADAYVRSINGHDSGAFLALFDDDACATQKSNQGMK
jgi:hypothetical protein